MKRRVLVVDDEPKIVKLVTQRLELSGFEVITAEDGEEALAKVRIGKPDLVILDLKLPKLSGYEVCVAIKKDAHSRHIPVMMFTAQERAMDERLGRECGADAFMTKPCNPSDLVEQIEALLGKMLGEGPLKGEPPGTDG